MRAIYGKGFVLVRGHKVYAGGNRSTPTQPHGIDRSEVVTGAPAKTVVRAMPSEGVKPDPKTQFMGPSNECSKPGIFSRRPVTAFILTTLLDDRPRVVPPTTIVRGPESHQLFGRNRR